MLQLVVCLVTAHTSATSVVIRLLDTVTAHLASVEPGVPSVPLASTTSHHTAANVSTPSALHHFSSLSHLDKTCRHTHLYVYLTYVNTNLNKIM